jgi:hypothetical protein
MRLLTKGLDLHHDFATMDLLTLDAGSKEYEQKSRCNSPGTLQLEKEIQDARKFTEEDKDFRDEMSL